MYVQYRSQKLFTIQYIISDIGRLDGNRVFRIKIRTNVLIKTCIFKKQTFRTYKKFIISVISVRSSAKYNYLTSSYVLPIL